MGQGQSEVIDDPRRSFRQRGVQNTFKPRVTEIKEGRDRNDGAEYFKAELKTADKILGDLF